jgi:hypothetical protein
MVDDYDPMNPDFCPICGSELVPHTVFEWSHDGRTVNYSSFQFTPKEIIPPRATPIRCLMCTSCYYIDISGEGAEFGLEDFDVNDTYDDDWYW